MQLFELFMARLASSELLMGVMWTFRVPIGFLVLLALVCVSAYAGSLSQKEANVVLQWGNPQVLGVGPYAVGNFSIPPTPSGVYEDLEDGKPVIPLNATTYLHSTNGAMYMVITSEGTGLNRENRFFVAGQAPGDLENRYPTPVELTSQFCHQNYCLSSGVEILDFELLDGMLVFVVSFEPGAYDILSMTFMTTETAGLPLGRTEYAGPYHLLNAVLTSQSFVGRLNLTCGVSWCAILTPDSVTPNFFWGDFGTGQTVPTSINFGSSIELIGAFDDTMIVVLANKDVIPVGTVNRQGRFGDTFSGFSVSLGDLNTATDPVIQAVCGYAHCLLLYANGTVTAFGNNTHGQCGAPVASSNVLDLPAIQLKPVQNPSANYRIAGLTGIVSIGAIGKTSYALNGDGHLFAWGQNTKVVYPGAGDDWFGMPTSLASLYIPTNITSIPAEVKLIRAPSMPTATNLGVKIRAVFVPAIISQQDFDKLSAYKIGLSSRTTSVEPGKQGLLTWGAGLGAGYGFAVPFANRSTSSKSAYAPGPLIVELPDIGTSQWSTVTGNSYVTFLYSSNINLPLYYWGTASSDGASTNVINGYNHIDGPILYSPNARSPIPLYSPEAFAYASAKEWSCGLFNINTDAAFFCWGRSTKSEMANGGYVAAGFAPAWPSSAVISMSCGTVHCAFLRTDISTKLVYSFSLEKSVNKPNQQFLCRSMLAIDGDLPSPVSMTYINILEDFTSVALGPEFTILATTAKVYVCGMNNGTDDDVLHGVLGSSVPSLVYADPTPLADYPMSQVVAGASHALGLNTTGVYSWGRNNYGQLGRSTASPWVMEQVTGLPGSVTSIAAVSDTSFAILADGTLYAWGRNDFQLIFGDPWTITQGMASTPVLLDINAALGVNFQIQKITSSPILKTVYALGTYGSAMVTGKPVISRNKLNWFGADLAQQPFVDGDLFYSTATRPASVFHYNEEPMWNLDDDEAVMGGQIVDGQYGFLWTNKSRIYVTGTKVSPIDAPGNPQKYPKTQLRNPVLLYTEPTKTIVSVQFTTIENLFLLYSDGTTISIRPEGSLTNFPPTNLTSVSCNIEICVTVKMGTSAIELIDSAYSTLAYGTPVITAQGPYALSGNSTQYDANILVSTLGPSTELILHRMEPISTHQEINVTGEFPTQSVVVNMVAGYDHYLALSDYGLVYGYGSNTFGQLSSDVDCSTSFKLIFESELSGKEIIKLAATATTSFAISASGEVYAWGYIPSEGPYMGPRNDIQIENRLSWFSSDYGALHTYPSPTKLHLPPTSGIFGIKHTLPATTERMQSLGQWAWWNGPHASPNYPVPVAPVPSTPTSTPTSPPTSSPTSGPPSNPPTSSPPTSNPPTSNPPTSNPPTSNPPTSNPPTSNPPTSNPSTPASPSQSPVSTPVNPPVAFPPTLTPLPPLQPPGPACPTPPNNGNWACDPATGTLYLAGSFTISSAEKIVFEGNTVIVGDFALTPGASVTVKGKLTIIGDFSLPAGSSLDLPLDSNIFKSGSSAASKRYVNEGYSEMGVSPPVAATNDPVVSVSGCADINSPIVASADEEAQKEIKKSGEKGKAINIVESSCSQPSGRLLVEAGPDSQKGCRRYTAQQQETTSDGRSTLSALLVINHDSCNHWWIILICVLAVLAVAAVVAVIIFKVPALKRTVLPYHGSNF